MKKKDIVGGYLSSVYLPFFSLLRWPVVSTSVNPFRNCGIQELLIGKHKEKKKGPLIKKRMMNDD